LLGLASVTSESIHTSPPAGVLTIDTRARLFDADEMILTAM